MLLEVPVYKMKHSSFGNLLNPAKKSQISHTLTVTYVPIVMYGIALRSMYTMNRGVTKSLLVPFFIHFLYFILLGSTQGLFMK